MPIYLKTEWLVLEHPTMFQKFWMTLKAAKRAPFIHLLLCLIRTVRLGGASVKALASGIYVR